MKKNVLIGLVAVLVSFGAFAQESKDRKVSVEDRAKWKTEAMKKKLDLNDEQYSKLYAIHLEEGRAAELKRKAEMEARKKHNAQLKEKYSKILTKEQVAKLEEYKRKDGRKRAGHKPHGRG